MRDIITFFMHNSVLMPHCIFHFNAQYAPEFECSLQRNEGLPINITVQCRLPGIVFKSVAPSLCTVQCRLPGIVFKSVAPSLCTVQCRLPGIVFNNVAPSLCTVQCRLPGIVFNNVAPSLCTVQCRLPGIVFNNVAPSLCTELPRPVLRGQCSSISLEPWQSWMCAGVDSVCLPALLHAAVLAGLPQRCLLKLTVGPDTCIPKDGLLRISSPTGIKFVTPPSKQWSPLATKH